jgi:hypothetical protein
VFLGVKAHGLTALAPGLRQLYQPDTCRRQHAERHPVVVLPGPWRRAGRPAGSSAWILAA